MGIKIKPLKNCHYEVGLYNHGAWAWEAATSDENGLNKGVLDSGGLYKEDGSSITPQSAKRHWKRFAELNGIKSFEWIE